MLSTLCQLSWHTGVFYAGFAYFYIIGGSIDDPTVQWLLGQDRVTAVHLYTLSKQLLLWHAPHYRAPSFAADLRKNLKNVGIPGTGVPLSLFCYNRFTALLFILVVNPVVCCAAACYLVLSNKLHAWLDSSGIRQQRAAQQYSSVVHTYRELLLCPQHWFAIWRHNCLVVGYHALVTGSSSYRLEDKGVFLLEGDRLGLPVSPFYKDAAVFVKHKSIEGGMGINVYKNFACGGDWIIQKALRNSSALAQLLPHDAPLSTLRVVTSSSAWLDAQGRICQHTQLLDEVLVSKQRAQTPPLPVSNGVLSRRLLHPGAREEQQVGTSNTHSQTSFAGSGLHAAANQQHQQQNNSSITNSADTRQQQHQPASLKYQQGAVATLHGNQGHQQCEDRAGCVQVVTAVWRAGLAGADTDHSCVCFAVDTSTGQLGPGVTANHWYRVGIRGLGAVSSLDMRQQLVHPQSGRQVTGVVLPEIPDVLAAVVQAHSVAAPDVPLIGWDVALTPDGVFILEANISCNLFDGCFDAKGYYELLHRLLAELEAAGRQQRSVNHSTLSYQR